MHPALQTACEFIEQNYMLNIKVSDVSTAAGLAYETTCRKFHATFGETIKARINRLRIDLAKKRLEEGTESIKEIASMVGFGSNVQFHRCFHQQTGTSPMQYRARQWQLNQPRILDDP